MTKKTDEERRREYIRFMHDPKNICCCDRCPENVGHDGKGFDYRYPCDQQNCWVEAHCFPERFSR